MKAYVIPPWRSVLGDLNGLFLLLLCIGFRERHHRYGLAGVLVYIVRYPNWSFLWCFLVF
ncbi:hypothetical protein V8F20_002364 [Naviculisporaceae sp. PSN 640]